MFIFQLPLLVLGEDQHSSGASLPFPVKVGTISQKFTSTEEGIIENIIKYSVLGLLDDEGLTAVVRAR